MLSREKDLLKHNVIAKKAIAKIPNRELIIFSLSI